MLLPPTFKQKITAALRVLTCLLAASHRSCPVQTTVPISSTDQIGFVELSIFIEYFIMYTDW